MGKLSEIDAMKQGIDNILYAADQQGSKLHQMIDEFVERRTCSCEMIVDLGSLITTAYRVGQATQL